MLQTNGRGPFPLLKKSPSQSYGSYGSAYIDVKSMVCYYTDCSIETADF
jgi:hypothetical protein